MKTFLIFNLIIILVSCKSNVQKVRPSNYVLKKHLQSSKYTNPGELAYLYNDLPKSLDQLCNLIKKQLIHPFDLEKFTNKIPKGREFEDQTFPTVSLMLAELIRRDGTGLHALRKPENRLVVACVHHSMLLASILRHRGIPVRIRSGFAKYIGERKNIHVSHVICEVWQEEQGEWILVDPDRNKVNFSRNEFEFSYETWTLLRNNSLGKVRYVSRDRNIDRVTVHLLMHDLSYILGNEESYWKDPPIVLKINENISDLADYELNVLDKIAVYLKNPDNHLTELGQKVTENKFLHF